jgi:nucleoside-diphosphate-sugar epimerase
MSRFRNARACLVMSTTTVYSRPLDPKHSVVEDDPLGEGPPPPFSPSYRASKLAQEGVARYAAREFDLPTTIARMDVAYGDNGGLPSMLLDLILAGQPVPISGGGTNVCDPIHEDDIYAHVPGLIEGASVPATITNWVGDVHVDIRDLCRYMAELIGREASFVESDAGNALRAVDSTRRIELAGTCVVDWKEGVRRMIEARHPELLG